MRSDILLNLNQWIAAASLEGMTEGALLQGLAERLTAAGLPLWRVTAASDTLHPVLGGRGFTWHSAKESVYEGAYARSQGMESEDKWLRSPFHYLLERNEIRLRRRCGDGINEPAEFPILEELAEQGCTDYVAYATQLGESAVIGEMDCIYSSWATNRHGGFSDEDIETLDGLTPALAASIRSISLGRILETLVETYLGRDAGQRVLRGSIERGVAERIKAVLWFSDLRGFTGIVDSVEPELVIPLLNDYADAIVTSIHDHGGQVMKFMGDGVLGFFPVDGHPSAACGQALDAAKAMRERVDALNLRRAAEEQPVSDVYLALHVGFVFYGNVGGVDRLDFTVVGPTVNEASRISAMCRSLEQNVILSSSFAKLAGESRDRLVSLGRYALRGVARPQELFTIDPERG